MKDKCPLTGKPSRTEWLEARRAKQKAMKKDKPNKGPLTGWENFKPETMANRWGPAAEGQKAIELSFRFDRLAGLVATQRLSRSAFREIVRNELEGMSSREDFDNMIAKF